MDSLEPAVKRSRTGLQPEDEWAQSHAGEQSIHVLVPKDDSTPSWNLKGQTEVVSLPLSTKIAGIKALLKVCGCCRACG